MVVSANGWRWVFLVILFLFARNIGAEPNDAAPVILTLGDSLTAGLGVPENESYPSRLQELLRAEGYPHRVVNAGVSGDTAAGGASRIDWLLRQEPRIVIVALGANDGLRGLPVPAMEANLRRVIQTCLKRKARVALAGMKIPPNFGEEYTRDFAAVFPRLARKFHLPLIPFLLEGVAAKREYTQPDGIHPTGAGYAVVANNVWKILKPMLR